MQVHMQMQIRTQNKEGSEQTYGEAMGLHA